jgi:hypothetical protein
MGNCCEKTTPKPVDILVERCYTSTMNLNNEQIQWIGAVAIIAGHSLNAVGPAAYPYNIYAFAVGTIAFLAWSIRVGNRPQLAVNLVAFGLGIAGIYNAVS